MNPKNQLQPVFSFESLKKKHLPLLLKWLNSPHVKQFWDTGIAWTEQLVEENYGSYIDGYKLVGGLKLPIQAFIISLLNTPIGYIQLYDASVFENDNYILKDVLKGIPFENFRLAAIDIFIGEMLEIKKGVGSATLRQFLKEHVFNKEKQEGYDGCIVDPDKANVRAIRAYEKSGFRKIKDTPDHKAIIMIATSRDNCKMDN